MENGRKVLAMTVEPSANGRDIACLALELQQGSSAVISGQQAEMLQHLRMSVVGSVRKRCDDVVANHPCKAVQAVALKSDGFAVVSELLWKNDEMESVAKLNLGTPTSRRDQCCQSRSTSILVIFLTEANLTSNILNMNNLVT
jgi:hypothetical protein